MWPEVHPFRTTTIRLLEGDLFTFTVDAKGAYVDWPNLYCVVALRPTGIALSTMQARMGAVCQFHNWGADKGIDIRACIEGLSFFQKRDVDDLRNELRVNLLSRPKQQRRGGRRKPKRPVVTNAQWHARCAAVRDYVAWHAEHVIQRVSPRDGRLPEARERLKDFRDWMTAGIMVRKGAPRESIQGGAQEIFLRAITPSDPTNPFAPRHQQRNYALWLLYFDGGIRRSEGLGLKSADLKLHGSDPQVVVHRRPDDPDEVRSLQPNTKTLPHPVSLTHRLASALHAYVVGHRPRYRGAKSSPYVFFGQMGKPISVKTVHYMCEMLRSVPGMPDDFTTHLLRYGWNDRFSEAAEELGLTDDQAKRVRNFLQGWTPTSEQGHHYSRNRNRRSGQRIGMRMQGRATKGAA